MTRTRMDVWGRTVAEGSWPAVLVAYERAVGLMRALDPPAGRPTDRLSWQFQAAIHGRARADGRPDTHDLLWNSCQHGSWYFLPWHRMYLRAFEAIVAHTLGDDDWSLPYWYAVDPDHPESSVLPPAFREVRMDNNLFTGRRSLLANGGDRLPDLASSLTDALQADVFSTLDGLTTFGGGERSSPSFNGEESGLLEDTPHGGVHVLVGNDYGPDGKELTRGWMGSFYTAGLDPIFWLHHANLDRLWQMWLDADASHLNPPNGDPAWFDTRFSFPAPNGGDVTWSVGEVLDTLDLGYRYESVQPPSTVPVPVPEGLPEIGGVPMIVPRNQHPQTVGAAMDVSMVRGARVEVAISEPDELGAAFESEALPVGSRWYVRLEGLTGRAAAPVYEVYLNLPAGDSPAEHPELLAGRVSTFGVAEASRPTELSDGTGVTKVLEITGVRAVLAEQGRWDPAALTVAFVPVIPAASDREAADELAARAGSAPPELRAARVSVITT